MKICLLRLSAIGDVTHALAVVRRLQTVAPDVEITWIIGKLEHKLLAGVDGVEFIIFDKSQGAAAFGELRQALKRRRFDVLLHMQVSMRANVASLLVRADRRIGYDRERSRDLHGLVIRERIAPGDRQHALDAMMSFIVPLGFEPAEPRWDLPVSNDDRAWAAEHVDIDRQTLCISPISSHKLRNWTVGGYAAAADHAVAKHGMQVILVGGPGDFDKGFNARIESEMRSPVLNLTGKDTLTRLAALLGQVDLLLAPDTGPMHIGNAMGTDVIGLHAASNPYRSGPYNSARWCVDCYDSAAQKFLGKSAAELPWGTKIEFPGVMELISIDRVTAKLDEWVAAR